MMYFVDPSLGFGSARWRVRIREVDLGLFVLVLLIRIGR